ncbi:MAG: SH3 domain-containing protein [Sandaracinus sp.]|nr:SH3 domain-containing protein [Sandaracinus sp.]
MADRERHVIARLLAVCAFALVAASSSAQADDVEVFARVVVDSTPLRSGPGSSFRQVGLAVRGDTFPVKKRATSGYWFQIERPDGTLAWVLGDAVYNHELGEGEGPRYRVFAPPPLRDAHVEIAATFGSLGGGGLMAIRPTFLIAPYFGLEITAAVAVSRAGRLLLAGGGGLLNLFPDWPVVPYFAVGGGVTISDPNSDTFLLESGSIPMLYGGGGLRFGFRQRLTLRLEVRAYAFFEPGRYVAQEEYSGGLSVFF